MKIQLKHSVSNSLKEVKYGFSWSSLFFGPIIPLLRGDIIWCILWFVLTGSTVLLFWMIFPFIYNKLYLKKLLSSGYIPANKPSENFLLSKNLILKNIIQTETTKEKSYSDKVEINKQSSNNLKNETSEKQDEFSNVIKNIVNKVVTENQGRFQNVATLINGTITDKHIQNISKRFPNVVNEEVLLYIEAFGTFLAITTSNYYLRLVDYYFEVKKNNYAFPINTTNLEVSPDNLSGHAIFKCKNMADEKKELGCVVDLAWPLTKNKKEDIQLVIESVSSLNKHFFNL